MPLGGPKLTLQSTTYLNFELSLLGESIIAHSISFTRKRKEEFQNDIVGVVTRTPEVLVYDLEKQNNQCTMGRD